MFTHSALGSKLDSLSVAYHSTDQVLESISSDEYKSALFETLQAFV